MIKELQIGSIIKDIQNDSSYRVIYLNRGYILCVLLSDYKKKLQFGEFQRSSLIELMGNGTITIHKPNFKMFDYNQLSDKNKTIYDRNKEIIFEAEKEYGPCFFEIATRKRKPIIDELARKFDINNKTVIEIVKRYLLSGKNEASLIDNRGTNKGQNINYKRKVGHPSSLVQVGIPLDDNLREIFEKAKRYYLSKRNTSYQNTYDWMCAKYFTAIKETKSENGPIITYELYPSNQRPTLKQMSNYIRNNSTFNQRKVSKTSKREFRNDHRLLQSDNLYNVLGPGDVVEMDEVEMDVSLVSEVDPSKVIGRPIVHCMIDVYSRKIIAISVSLENNSVLGLTNCLINLAEDNYELCKR